MWLFLLKCPKVRVLTKGHRPGDTHALLPLEGIFWKAIQSTDQTSSTLDSARRRDDSRGGCFSLSATEGADETLNELRECWLLLPAMPGESGEGFAFCVSTKGFPEDAGKSTQLTS